MNKVMYAAMIAVGTMAGLSACTKKDEAVTSNTGESNEALNAMITKSVQEDVDAATLHRGAMNSCNWENLLPACATVTESGDEYPIEIIIDYGDGCEDNFGRVKSGQIVINLTDEMLNEGATRTVTFVDFSVDEATVEGSRVISNIGESTDGYPQFSREINMSVTKFGYTFSRQFSGTATWLVGYDTSDCGDNVFELEGSGSCTRPNGVEVSRTIVEPLLIDRICGYITAGVVEVQAPMGTKTIDFGDGECDSTAEVTGPNGQTNIIDLNNFGPNGG